MMARQVLPLLLLAALSLVSFPSTGAVPDARTGAFRRLDGRITKWEAIKAVPIQSRVSWNSLQVLNDVINQRPYRRDEGDTWLTPREFLARGGDCEDYAIAKLVELGARGFEERWLVVAWDSERAQPHAFALTRAEATWLVLDNQYRRIRVWQDVLQRYQPFYAIDVGRDQLYQWFGVSE